MFRMLVTMAVAGALFSAPALAADKGSVYDRILSSGKIRCGYFSWPPYFMKDPNTGAMSGLNYDYMVEIGRVLGLKVEWTEETTPGTMITGLDSGRYDVSCASLWPDESRLKNALMTSPTFYSTVYAVVRKDDDRFDAGKKPLDSPDVTAAGLEGDVTYYLAKEEYPKAKLEALPQSADGSLLLQTVASKKADVALVDKGILADFNRTNGNVLKVVAGLPPVRVFPECLAVKRGEVELKILLDTAIKTINDSGKPAEFIKRYPGYEFFAPAQGWASAPK